MDFIDKTLISILGDMPNTIKYLALLLVFVGYTAYKLGWFKVFKTKPSKPIVIGACHDNPGRCRYDIILSQMNEVRNVIEPIKTDIKEAFAKWIRLHQPELAHGYDRYEKRFGVLVDASSYQAESEMRELFKKNSIPDSNSPSAEVYYTKRYNLVTNAVKDYIGRNWDTMTYGLIPYDPVVVKAFNDGKERYRGDFIGLVKSGRDLYINGVTKQ